MTYSNDPRPPQRDDYPGGNVVRSEENRLPDGRLERVIEYADGRVERQIRDDRLYADPVVRDNENAARGLLVGVIAACLVGLGLIAWYFLSRDQEPNIQRIIVPQQQSPSPSPTVDQPNINITVPSPASPQVPDVNTDITIPGQQAPAAPNTDSAPTINNNIEVPSPAVAPPASPDGADTAPGTTPEGTTDPGATAPPAQ